jgi:hypothetical protein
VVLKKVQIEIERAAPSAEELQVSERHVRRMLVKLQEVCDWAVLHDYAAGRRAIR